MRLPSVVLIVAFALLPVSQSHAAPATPSAVLVELFTSEGCSSCPPADELLRQIDHTRTDTGQLIVGISEHVTYWNSLGWSDPFSADRYTERQAAYGTRFRLDSVYTPQMVVNGREQFVGSDRASLRKALHAEQAETSSLTLHLLTASVDGGSLTATFDAEGAGSGSADLFAVLADDQAESHVLRGENSGHTLSHVAVARSLIRVGRLETGSKQTIHIPLPDSLRAGKGHHLILFAQVPSTGPILATVTQAF
jgi:hypothetical protein